ncbi:MAG: hypothetical protein M3Z17_00750 [Gemmatimonadota bacterium]|nr:hypothetical protein [Gemmatimonadota bacterium]
MAPLLSLACVRSAPEPTTFPLPAPSLPAAKGAAGWTMFPWKGSAMYRVSRSGSVSSDVPEERPVAASTAGIETLTREPSPGGASFTLAVTALGVPARRGAVAEKVSGLLTGAQLVLEPFAAVAACNPRIVPLRADLSDLAVPVTGTIALGESWSDSLWSTLCVSGIAGVVRVQRLFLVVGDTIIAGAGALIVERKDSVNLSGEGSMDRHPIALTGGGAGSARIYLSVPGGQVLRIERLQRLTIGVASSAPKKSFTQRSTSVIELSR